MEDYGKLNYGIYGNYGNIMEFSKSTLQGLKVPQYIYDIYYMHIP